MNLFGAISLSHLFGMEIRVLDGQECLFIPLKDNPCLRPYGDNPMIFLSIKEMPYPDAEGYTYLATPFLPKSVRQNIAQADYIKMTQPLGRFRTLGRPQEEPTPGPTPEPEPEPRLDYNTLAPRAVTDDDIPL